MTGPTTSGVAVTPAGVRDGDPLALGGLADRRGAAVLAYTQRVLDPDDAIGAAADAFGRFRCAVVEATDPLSIHPERLLLHATRRAVAARAGPDPARSALRTKLHLGHREPSSACALAPELLVARVERTLTEADDERLTRHLDRCGYCRELATRVKDAERAYRQAPDRPVPPQVAHELIRAMLEAAPIAARPLQNLTAIPAEPSIAAAAEAEPAEQSPALCLVPALRDEPLSADEPIVDDEPLSHGPALIPSPFHSEERPLHPRHPVARIVAPAGVGIVTVVGALALAGVFSVQRAAPVVTGPIPPIAPVITPLPVGQPAAAKHTTRRHSASKAKAAAAKSATTTTPTGLAAAPPSAARTPAALVRSSARRAGHDARPPDPSPVPAKPAPEPSVGAPPVPPTAPPSTTTPAAPSTP